MVGYNKKIYCIQKEKMILITYMHTYKLSRIYLQRDESHIYSSDRSESIYWSIPRVGKIPWRRKWQLTPIFLPGGLQSMGPPKSQA